MPKVLHWPVAICGSPSMEASSVFVPVISAVAEVIVKTASKLSNGPVELPSVTVCGPIVAVPVSSNVPVYGPVATPLAWNITVDVPSGLHVAVIPGVPVNVSPVNVGGVCALARQT
jgi:hypothetical protein